jgi:cardiolipin synthase
LEYCRPKRRSLGQTNSRRHQIAGRTDRAKLRAHGSARNRQVRTLWIPAAKCRMAYIRVIFAVAMFDFTLLGVGHLILGVALTFDVLLTKHRAVSAVLWLAIVWALPYGGALAYMSFGIDRVRRAASDRETAKAIVARRAALHPTFERLTIDYVHLDFEGPRQYPAQHIFRATDAAVRPYLVYRGNRVGLLVDGDEYYPALFEEVSKARSSVHLQTFIIGRDKVSRELLDLLIERRRAGVECRVLYDRFGSMYAHLFGFFKRARAAGIEVRSISQANPLKGRFQINLRNHRKISVIDGAVGFVGGINIHDENLSLYARGHPIRDYHVKLEGPAVSDLQFQFVEDWYFASRQAPERLLERKYFPELVAVGEAMVEVAPGGPELEGHGLADAFFAAIVAAERSLTIVTPYFIPDEPIVQAIRYAAMRGVAVRLVLPQRSNHWYTGFAARALYAPLLKAGVRIFERKPPFMHAKAMIVDDVYAMVGSANLDYRSLHLNFETNLEVADLEFVKDLRKRIEHEIGHSDEISFEGHQARPLPRRLAENFCYLFQPML